jgi:hypothetical protein
MTQPEAEGLTMTRTVRGLVAEVESLDDEQRLGVLLHLARYVPVAVGIGIDATLGATPPGATDET